MYTHYDVEFLYAAHGLHSLSSPAPWIPGKPGSSPAQASSTLRVGECTNRAACEPLVQRNALQTDVDGDDFITRNKNVTPSGYKGVFIVDKEKYTCGLC